MDRHQLCEKAWRAGVRGAALYGVVAMLFALGYSLALGLGAYLYHAGAITIGTVYLFFQYTELLRRCWKISPISCASSRRPAPVLGASPAGRDRADRARRIGGRVPARRAGGGV